MLVFWKPSHAQTTKLTYCSTANPTYKSNFAEVVEGIEMFEGRRSVSTSYSGAGLFQWPLHLGRGVVVGRHWKQIIVR